MSNVPPLGRSEGDQLNISVLLEVAAQIDPGRVIASDQITRLTCEELFERARGLAGALTSPDVRPGPVVVIATNSAAIPIYLYGAALAGRPLLPLNYRADAKLMRHFFSTLRPAIALAGEPYQALLRETAPDVPIVPTEKPFEAPAGELPAVDPNSPAVYVFSSGSTALPKAVTLRHRHLVSYVINSVEAMSELPEAATLISAPAYHVATIANMLTSTYAGRRMVFLGSFTPESWLETAERERVTHAFVVPTMLFRIVTEIENGARPPSSLEHIAYGGSKAPRETVERALKAFPSAGFVNAYGLTETSSTVAVLGPEDHRAAWESSDPHVSRRLSSVGRPLPGVDVKIAEDGEILVRGAQVSGEYAAAHSNAQRRVEPDGWFHTGDLGEIDDKGFLFILGRKDDMIIRGAENISPVEVENALKDFAGVRDAAVVGVQDPEWGQRVEAAVEGDPSIDPAEVIRFTRSRLPGFKCPVKVVVLEALPRNELGKVLRPAVLEALSR